MNIPCNTCITKVICSNKRYVNCSLLANWLRKYYIQNAETVDTFSSGMTRMKIIYESHGFVCVLCTYNNIEMYYDGYYNSFNEKLTLKYYINYISAYPDTQISEIVSFKK
jgi:hypothetical protein